MLLLTNLKVNVFKAFGSSTIFCKLAATVKDKKYDLQKIAFNLTSKLLLNLRLNSTHIHVFKLPLEYLITL